MGKYILALDQGTTSSRAILFDRDQNILGVSPEGVHPDLPQGGLGGARRHGDLVLPVCGDDGGHRPVRSGGGGHRRHRHHQPAGDYHPLGPGNRAGPSTTPSSGSAAGRRTLWTSCWRTAMGTTSERPPVWCPTPTSPPPRSNGFWTMWKEPARGRSGGRSSSAPWIAGWCGSSLAGRPMSPTTPTPPAPCSTTSTSWIGTTRCCAPWISPGLCCLKYAPPARSTAIRRSKGSRCPSRASPATSRRRCLDRPALRQGTQRTPTAPAAFC